MATNLTRNSRRIFKKERKNLRIFTALLLLGACIAFYPFVSQDLNQYYQSNEMTAQISRVRHQDFSKELAKAKEYNSRLSGQIALPVYGINNIVKKDYNNILKIPGVDSFAQISLPSVDITLPIYHDTTDDVLDKGVGHLYGTALPIGGAGNNSVLTAHTGLARAKMFDNLVDIHKGDAFQIQVAGETLQYKVTTKEVVSPQKAEELTTLVPGKDLVTLITCTPYSVNTHRLVVVGERDLGYTPPSSKDIVAVKPHYPLLSLGLMGILLTIFLVYPVRLQFIRRG